MFLRPDRSSRHCASPLEKNRVPPEKSRRFHFKKSRFSDDITTCVAPQHLGSRVTMTWSCWASCRQRNRAPVIRSVIANIVNTFIAHVKEFTDNDLRRDQEPQADGWPDPRGICQRTRHQFCHGQPLGEQSSRTLAPGEENPRSVQKTHPKVACFMSIFGNMAVGFCNKGPSFMEA